MKKQIYQLFLLRGLAREARHWGQFIDDLMAAYEHAGHELRIETIDLPGSGRHSEMFAYPTISQTADFAREKMKEILVRESEQGIVGATHRRLVSISLGGMVAARWMEKYPTDFHSAVVINSSFRGVSKMQDRLRWQSWWRIPKIVGTKTVEQREAKILDWVSNRPERRREVLSEWVAIQNSRPVSKLNLALQLTAASQFHAPSEISVPILVLASEKDRMVNPECSKAIAKRYDAKILFHETAGHDLPLDDGPWVASMIAEWQIENSRTPASSSPSV